MNEITFFEVGGCVRDDLLGIESKDVDFVAVAPSFEAMRDALVARGFNIWQERPEFVTIRAGVPEDDPLRARTKDADFVLARKDGPSSDGRRPDFVEPGDLIDDLARRDFTVNAIARNPETGELIDPFGGVDDLNAGVLRFVGDPFERIAEDGLRVIRGFRFMLMKGFIPSPTTAAALNSPEAVEAVASSSVAAERIRDELERMLRFDTFGTIELLGHAMSPDLLDVCFRQKGRLRLSATMAEA